MKATFPTCAYAFKNKLSNSSKKPLEEKINFQMKEGRWKLVEGVTLLYT